MAQDKSLRERRKRPRVKLKGQVQGSIQTVVPAAILDISEDGAQVETASMLKPGSLHTLRLAVDPDAPLRLRCRVVRSVLYTFDRASGESVARYRVAVQFVELSDTERSAIARQIGQLEGDVSAEITAEKAG
jgi:hypothetical protein